MSCLSRRAGCSGFAPRPPERGSDRGQTASDPGLTTARPGTSPADTSAYRIVCVRSDFETRFVS